MPSRPRSARARRVPRALGVATAAIALLVGPLAGPALAEVKEIDGFKPEACGLHKPNTDPDDKVNAGTWQVTRLKPERAWPYATGKGITVAVIDTGVTTGISDYYAEEIEHYNYADGEPEQEGFDCSHGTGVVGFINARKPEGSPRIYTGMAPDAEVISMRALVHGPADDKEEEEKKEDLAPTIKGIKKAVELDVDIINISQAGSHTPAYAAAVTEAQDAGILIVASAGNSGPNGGPSYPAAYPGVVAVGSTDVNDRPSEFSQSAEEMPISVAAPGTEVLRLEPSGERGQAMGTANGTSFSAPQVTGLAALIMERYPDLTAEQVKRRLETTADLPGGRSVPDPIIGYGVINPYRAMTDVMALEDPPPPTDPEKGESHPPLKHPFDEDRKDTATLVALGVGGGSILIVLVSLVISHSLPAGRDRKWKSAD